MLKLEAVTVIYPDQTKALDQVSFTLSPGENVALIGPNGAGKTSLLLALVGILELAGGRVELDGLELHKKTLPEIRRQMGLVFQNPDDQLFMPLIYDDIAFGCRQLGLGEEQVKSRVEEVLTRLNIAHLGGRSSLKLSGGEKRMAAIATVLAMCPSVLLFDEPTAFLDPRAKRALGEALGKLPHSKLIATHDLDFAAGLCERAILLEKGQLLADETKTQTGEWKDISRLYPAI